MTAERKFDFSLSFDEEDDASGSGGSSSRANAKVEEAFEAGKQAGLTEAQASFERQSAAAMDAISQGFAGIETTRASIEHAMQRNAMEMALALVAKALPALARREAMNEVQAVLSECLARLLDEPRIVVRVPDELLDPLKDKLDGLFQSSGFAGQVVLLADAALGPSDCRVEWADGGAERNAEDQWRDIEATIKRALSTPVTSALPAAAGSPGDTINNDT